MDIKKLDKNFAVKDSEKDLIWYNAEALTIEGKGWEGTEEFYDRLPAKAERIVRSEVWDLSKCSAGITIRFSTNSSSLSVKWDGFNAMEHMPALGVSGLDLYVKHDGKLKWLSSGRPLSEHNESELFINIDSEWRDFVLYLPLYNPVKKIELGISEKFDIKPSTPRTDKPIVFYGTSITQGGCASRPGMNYSAILGRKLDIPFINLGFSGNGIQEPEVIDLLCELEPCIYVLDNMPNMEEDTIKTRTEDAILKLRKAKPNTPIVLIDNMLYCDAYLNKANMERYTSSNKAQYTIYEKLIKKGIKNIHYIKDDGLIGYDGEGTVDGIHFTDLGYMRFSEKVFPVLKNLIKE